MAWEARAMAFEHTHARLRARCCRGLLQGVKGAATSVVVTGLNAANDSVRGQTLFPGVRLPCVRPLKTSLFRVLDRTGLRRAEDRADGTGPGGEHD